MRRGQLHCQSSTCSNTLIHSSCWFRLFSHAYLFCITCFVYVFYSRLLLDLTRIIVVSLSISQLNSHHSLAAKSHFCIRGEGEEHEPHLQLKNRSNLDFFKCCVNFGWLSRQDLNVMRRLCSWCRDFFPMKGTCREWMNERKQAALSNTYARKNSFHFSVFLYIHSAGFR